jgi:hypothetical protein
MSEQLPTTSFADLAFEIRVMATREADLNNAVEVFIARCPDNPGLALTLRDLQRSAERIGEAARLLSALAPIEADVRALQAEKTERFSWRQFSRSNRRKWQWPLSRLRYL